MNKIMIAMGTSLLLTTSAIAQSATTNDNTEYVVEPNETLNNDTTTDTNMEANSDVLIDDQTNEINDDTNVDATQSDIGVDTTTPITTDTAPALTEPTVVTDDVVDTNETVLIIRNNGDEECRISRVSSESSSDGEDGFFANIFGSNDRVENDTLGVENNAMAVEEDREYLLAPSQEHIIDTDLQHIFVVEVSGEPENGSTVPVTVDLGSCGQLSFDAVVRN